MNQEKKDFFKHISKGNDLDMDRKSKCGKYGLECFHLNFEREYTHK